MKVVVESAGARNSNKGNPQGKSVGNATNNSTTTQHWWPCGIWSLWMHSYPCSLESELHWHVQIKFWQRQSVSSESRTWIFYPRIWRSQKGALRSNYFQIIVWGIHFEAFMTLICEVILAAGCRTYPPNLEGRLAACIVPIYSTSILDSNQVNL